MDKYQAFAELMEDENKAKEIISDSIEQTQQNLKNNGLDFTLEELKEMAAKVVIQDSNDELDEDALNDVNGGILMSTLCGVALGCYAISSYAGVVKKWMNSR